MCSDRIERLLDSLRKSVLFSDGFPCRTRLTHAEFSRLDEEGYLRSHEPGHIAMGRANNVRELEGVVKQIGQEKHPDSVPLLADLWSNCALAPVRTAAGHALRTIGTPEARRALFDLIEDSDHLSVFLAIAVVFDEAPELAYDRLAHYFEPGRVAQPGGSVIPNAVLRTFAPWSFVTERNGESTPQWSDSRAPSWLRQEPRWARLCIALRRDKRLGATAREVLCHADPTLVNPLLEEAQRREGPRVVRPTTKATGDLLIRYRRGQRDAVWNELRSHDALGGDLLEEARALANETMQRVARAADLLSERLADREWQPLYAELRDRPLAMDQDVMREIEEITGAGLPVALRAFWEVVGGINFVWNYESGGAPTLGVDLPMDEMDPLCVDSARVASQVIDVWEDQRAGINPEFAGPFDLDLAPDYLHKANISGGGPYGIELPFLGADPIFAGEAHNLPFIDYLRLCFRWAGFPRLERHAERPDVREFVQAMTKDVEPF